MSVFNPELKQSDIDWFHTKYTKVSDEECWPWTNYKTKFGYGQMTINYTVYYAHQLAYFIKNGPYDMAFMVRHICDNPWCVNPDHMQLGTTQDNTQDKVNRGRQNRGSTLLTDEELVDIHKMYADGLEQGVIADKYNLNRSFISRVINGKRLRHQSENVGMKFAMQ